MGLGPKGHPTFCGRERTYTKLGRCPPSADSARFGSVRGPLSLFSNIHVVWIFLFRTDMFVDYPSTCGKPIRLVSRDTHMSNFATWAYMSYSSKSIQPITLHGSRVTHYSYYKYILKSTILIHIKPKTQPDFLQNRPLR